MDSLHVALNTGFSSIKINTVMMENFNDDEIFEMVDFTMNNEISWRFIELMSIGPVKDKYNTIDSKILINRLKEKYNMEKITENFPVGNGPAEYYKIKGSKGFIGFISPVSHNFCHMCNRLRLTADGKLRFCLMGEDEIDILKIMRDGSSRENLKKEIENAIKIKQSKLFNHEKSNQRFMYQIGG